MSILSTGVGAPLSSRTETSASPVFNSVMAFFVSSCGFSLKVSATILTVFLSFGVKALKACWILVPSCPIISSGISSGLWLIKYKPTPLERIRRTTCSILSTSDCGALSNNR